jgi:NOL1/NOP2/fmu family ribosome biogenesis protein
LRKSSLIKSSKKNNRDDKKNTKIVTKSNVNTFSLLNPERWMILQEENHISAFDKNRLNDFLFIKKQMKCMHSGILLGEFKGKDFIPSTSIALSKMFEKENVEQVDVDYRTAISFLRKEAIIVPDCPKGYVLITFKGQALGWVKNLGNRTNNLYPQEWRIRMKI